MIKVYNTYRFMVVCIYIIEMNGIYIHAYMYIVKECQAMRAPNNLPIVAR